MGFSEASHFNQKFPRGIPSWKCWEFVSLGLDQGSAKPDLPPVFMVHKLRMLHYKWLKNNRRIIFNDMWKLNAIQISVSILYWGRATPIHSGSCSFCATTAELRRLQKPYGHRAKIFTICLHRKFNQISLRPLSFPKCMLFIVLFTFLNTQIRGQTLKLIGTPGGTEATVKTRLQDEL